MGLTQQFQVHPVPNTTPCAKRAQIMCRAKKIFAPSGTDFAQLQLLRARAPRGGMRRHRHMNSGRDGRRGCELPKRGWVRGRYPCSSRIRYDIRIRNSESGPYILQLQSHSTPRAMHARRRIRQGALSLPGNHRLTHLGPPPVGAPLPHPSLRLLVIG